MATEVQGGASGASHTLEGGSLIEEILAWASRLAGAPVDLVASDRGVRWGLAERLSAA